MTAGTLPVGAAASTAAVATSQVSISQPVYDQFTHMFFVYQMGTAVEVLILAFLFFVFRPYLPFILSQIWTHLPVVGLMTRVRNIVPMSGFTLRNGMYKKELKNNVLYFDKKYKGSYFFLGVPFDFVHIDRGFVQEPIYNKFLSTLYEMGYKNIDDIENALTFNKLDPLSEDIEAIVHSLGYETYELARQAINPSGITEHTEIFAPIMGSCPLDTILGYGAEIIPGSIAAQVSDSFKARCEPVEPNFIMDVLPYAIILVSLGIAVAMMATQIK